MSEVVKFDFGKTYKEIDVNGKLYKMDMSDDAQDGILDALKKAQDLADASKKKDPENMTAEELKEMRVEQRDIAIGVVDAFLGEGSGQELYESLGRSTATLLKLINSLQETFQGFINASYEDEKKKFTKKSK